MASNRELSRKPAAILHADVAGSTTLVQIDETLAHQRINDAFTRLSKIIGTYGGTVHEIRGDALVAECPRASDAACAALQFQQSNSKILSALHPERSTAGSEATLTAAYAQLDRRKDAADMVQVLNRLWMDFYWREPSILDIMTHFPFRKAGDAKRLAENLYLAGVCCEQDAENVLRSKKE